MSFSFYQFLKQRYSRHIAPSSEGKLATSNQDPGLDDEVKIIQSQKKEYLDMKYTQSFLSKEMRKEMLSIEERLRNEIKMELSNMHKLLKDTLVKK